jgi:hypothetical protein
VTNRGPEAATIHVLPQLWYRNTWSWESDEVAPRITVCRKGVATTHHPDLGERWFSVTSSTGDVPDQLFCENETNNQLLFGSANDSSCPKDGVNDYVVHGNSDAINANEGSKVAAYAFAALDSGETLTVTVRLAPEELELPFADADTVLEVRKAEADEFYGNLAAADLSVDERLVQRQALAGLGAQAGAMQALGELAGVPIFPPYLLRLSRLRPAGAVVAQSGAGGGDVALYFGLDPSPSAWRASMVTPPLQPTLVYYPRCSNGSHETGHPF